MIVLIFVASVLVAVLLERQARQHALERGVEYERLGIPVPRRRPKLKKTEAWLNVGLGLVLVALSVFAVMAGIQLKVIAERFPGHAPDISGDFSMAIQNSALFLAGGVALAWLGWRALREITRYESGAIPTARGAGRHSLTAAIAGGAFCAGILTGYLLLSHEPPAPAAHIPYHATVSLDIEPADESGIPAAFAQELEQRFALDLGSIPGVRVVRTDGADFRFRATLGRDDGFVLVSWNVVRAHDSTPYLTRTFTVPVESPDNPLRIMMSSLSSAFGEKRTTTEFERILQLPENSLD